MTQHDKMLFDFLTALTVEDAMSGILRPMVEDALEQEAKRFGVQDGLVYRGPSDFVLQHGTWFNKIAVVPPKQRSLYGYC